MSNILSFSMLSFIIHVPFVCANYTSKYIHGYSKTAVKPMHYAAAAAAAPKKECFTLHGFT